MNIAEGVLTILSYVYYPLQFAMVKLFSFLTVSTLYFNYLRKTEMLLLNNNSNNDDDYDDDDDNNNSNTNNNKYVSCNIHKKI